MAKTRSGTRLIRGALLLAGAALLTLWSAAPGLAESGTDRWDPNGSDRDAWLQDPMAPGMQMRMVRHWTFMHKGVPETYRDAHNPTSPTPETIDVGRALYQVHCQACHGATGRGDGNVANALNPSPALLAYLIQMPMTVDSYLLWSVAEGGAAFGTEMPAFRDALSRDDIWKIITFLRAGFPGEPQP